MKYFAMTLALVTLVMVGPASADWEIDVTRNADPAAGLESYTLSIEVISGYGPKAFQDFLMTDVHQTHGDYQASIPTVYTDDFWDETELCEYGKYDTHFLFAESDVVGTQKEYETNDDSNPAGLPFYEYFELVGIGMFQVDGAFEFAGPLPDGFEFMQVVVLSGTSTKLHFMADENGEMVARSVHVPEPSTILMLLAGSLCLLTAGYRR